MSTSVAVCRDIYTEDRFRQTYGSADATSHNEGIRETLSRRCTCADGACLHLLKERVPVLAWLPRYRLRKWLLGDLVAGVTVGIVHIPQGMAFALLTSVAPVYGLYTSFLPVVLYMLLGTGRHVSTGTFAVLSLMTGSVVDTLVPTPPQLNTSVAEVTALQAQRIGVASAVAFLSGAMMLFMFSLQLGFLSTFLSEPIVKAFTSAAAFHVTVSQLQSMLGLQLPRQTGQFSLFKTLAAVLENLPLTNLAELGISLACLALLVPVREMNARCRHRLRTPVPMEIVTVIVATGVAYGLSLDAEYGVQIVGPIPAGFPRPVLPSLRVLPDVAADAAAITAVSYAVSVSLAMIYADKHGYTIQPNQELFAHGISNTVSSLFTCFPSSATLATTNILESAGGHTQLAGLFTSLVVLVVLMLIGPLFHFLPKAVLACINVTSLRQMFLQLQDLPDLWRISRMDFVVWVVTWLSVVVLSVDVGLAIGVVFSMMTVICRTQRAGCWVLGRASNTEIYRPLDLHSKCSEVPGLRILAYNGPIYYGNRSFFRSRVSRLLGMSPERTHSVSHANRAHIAHSAAERSQREVVSTVDRGVANASFSPGNEFIKPEMAGTERQAVLIDCSSVIFVDVAGAKLFVQMCVDCQKGGMQMFLAGCNESVLKILTSSGLMQHMRPHHIFVTVHDAVVYVQQQREKHVEDSSPPCV